MSDTDITKLSQFEKWVKVIKELGFPIVVAAILLWSHFTVMSQLTNVMSRNVSALERVERFLVKSEK